METGPYSEWSQGYLDGHNAALNAHEDYDAAQSKADKLLSTLREAQKLIRQINSSNVNGLADCPTHDKKTPQKSQCE